ncbi:MAG: efflux RND transporter periplasmic adaptor subunit [Candidatus Competibacteraceae bacterium]|nr:efflux RND transporter periplasmic adaptor subunit [Candidatus Competibacteraceae bacterium]
MDQASPLSGARLRSDLAIREVADSRGRRYQIRNPATGEQFELGEEEWFLCRQLDGFNDPAAIRDAFAHRFGIDIDCEALAAFYREMAALGLLAAPVERAGAVEPGAGASGSAAAVAGPAGARARPSRQRAWTLGNPEKWVAGLARRLRGLRGLVWGLIPGLPLAFFILLHHQPQYYRALAQTGQFGFHLLVKLTVGLFCVNLLSQLLQAVACRHYGGRVDRWGIRLAFGVIPRFFFDHPLRGLERRERLWVIATPLLVKLGLFASGVLLWQFNLQGPARLSAYAFVLWHLALGAALFTANPLWRATGYAWLTAYLDFPRLRERAFAALRLLPRNAQPLKLLSARERYALLTYAVATAAYAALLFGTVLLVVAANLETRFQGVGVLLFLVVLVAFSTWLIPRLRGPAARGLRSASAGARPPIQRLPTVSAPPDTAPPPPTPQPIAPKSARSRWASRLLALVLLGALLALPYPYAVTGGATLLPNRRAEVHATVPGAVNEILVHENQALESGAVLARLSDWKPRYDVAATRAEIEKKRNELQLLQNGSKPEAIALAQQQLALAQVKAAATKKLQDVLAAAAKQGVAPELRHTEASGNADIDKAALAVASANLQLVKSPPLPTEVAIKHAELQQLNEQLRYFQQQLEATQLRAPIAGRVVTPRLEFKLGGFLKEGDLFATLEETQKIQVEVLVPETDIGAVKLDAPVTLRVWAYPLLDFQGAVSLIADTAEPLADNPSVRAVRVITLMDNRDGLLKAEMTGYAKIAAGREPVIVAFTRALVRFAMLEMWSWLP